MAFLTVILTQILSNVELVEWVLGCSTFTHHPTNISHKSNARHRSSENKLMCFNRLVGAIVSYCVVSTDARLTVLIFQMLGLELIKKTHQVCWLYLQILTQLFKS